MQFCIYCGAGLSAFAEQQRQNNPLSWRTCLQCGRSDELNRQFCVFCSGKIIVPGQANPNSSAFSKFSWELERIDVGEAVVRDAAQNQPARKKAAEPFNWAIPAAGVGVAVGVGIALLVGTSGLLQIMLAMTWPREGLVVYAAPNADVIVEDLKGQHYGVARTSPKGSLAVSGLPSTDYFLKISTPEGLVYERKQVPIKQDRTTVLGFPKRLKLTAKNRP
jgi:hypothetical protein